MSIITKTNNQTNNLKMDGDDQESVVNLKTNRLGKCEVCASVNARYTCPKCELKTCSLGCVRIHKTELECDGKRDRTKFISLRNMTKMDFMSDYYFLEECTRYVEDRKTDDVKRFTRYNKQLPTHLFRLRAAANQRGTTLYFLLQNFTRHKENTTFLNWKERRIYWRVEWIFMNAGERKYVDERCSEDQPLWKLLERYLNIDEAILQNVPERKELKYYQSKGAFSLKILLKAEHIKDCRKRFYEMDASKTLKENLAGKILIEYPIIYLFCDTLADDMDIIDSDEDVQAETKAYLNSLDELRRQRLASIANEKEKESDTEKVEDDNGQLKSEEPKKKRSKCTDQPQNFLFNDDNEDFSSSSNDEI